MKPRCLNCWTELLAGPSGWVCESCDAKIVPYHDGVQPQLDIVPSDTTPGRKPCDECDGTGNVECEHCDGDGYTVCDHCGSDVDCEHCGGEGSIECAECGGTCFEEEEHPYKIWCDEVRVQLGLKTKKPATVNPRQRELL